MKIKKRTAAIALAALIVLVVFGVLVARVNRRYPPVDILIEPQGTTIEYFGAELVVGKGYFVEQAALIEQGIYGTGTIEGDLINLIVPVTLKNMTGEELTIELYPLVAESNDWFNGINLDEFFALNGEDATLMPVLAPQEELALNLVFDLYEFMFTPVQWEGVTEMEYSLVANVYPEKWVFEI